MSWSKKGRKNRNGRREQLCWDCANACGGCVWSAFKMPVPGWDAEEDILACNTRHNGKISYRGIPTFRVYNCPLYIDDRGKHRILIEVEPICEFCGRKLKSRSISGGRMLTPIEVAKISIREYGGTLCSKCRQKAAIRNAFERDDL